METQRICFYCSEHCLYKLFECLTCDNQYCIDCINEDCGLCKQCIDNQQNLQVNLFLPKCYNCNNNIYENSSKQCLHDGCINQLCGKIGCMYYCQDHGTYCKSCKCLHKKGVSNKCLSCNQFSCKIEKICKDCRLVCKCCGMDGFLRLICSKGLCYNSVCSKTLYLYENSNIRICSKHLIKCPFCQKNFPSTHKKTVYIGNIPYTDVCINCNRKMLWFTYALQKQTRLSKDLINYILQYYIIKECFI